MALVIIYAVLSHFDFVAKFTVKNLNKDFTNTGRGGRGHHVMKVFHKIRVFFKRWLPLVWEGFTYMAFEIRLINNTASRYILIFSAWWQHHWVLCLCLSLSFAMFFVSGLDSVEAKKDIVGSRIKCVCFWSKTRHAGPSYFVKQQYQLWCAATKQVSIPKTEFKIILFGFQLKVCAYGTPNTFAWYVLKHFQFQNVKSD